MRLAEPDPHRPHRGSAIETWIRDFRNRYPKGTPWFAVLDELLDDYRLRADTGLSVADDIGRAGESGAES